MALPPPSQPKRTRPVADTWASLRPYAEPIPSDAQVLLVSGTGGAKSTLAATMTLRVPSLVVLDDKAAMTLPHARVVELPPYNADEPAASPGTPPWGGSR